jgi:2-haloacid dehalogenase
MKSLSDYKAMSFDCYGTLIDWETGIWNAGQPLLIANKSSTITRDTFLKTFASAETYQEAITPKMIYPELLNKVHQSIAKTFSFATNDQMDLVFGGSVRDWPEFPDSKSALKFLKKKMKLIILSNVDQKSFKASRQKLGIEFDAVYTADDIGSYKPNPNNFSYMIQRLKKDFKIQLHEILHVAQSMHHDLVEARKQGLDIAWIDRQKLSTGGDWGATAKVPKLVDPEFLFFSMSEMVTAYKQIC